MNDLIIVIKLFELIEVIEIFEVFELINLIELFEVFEVIGIIGLIELKKFGLSSIKAWIAAGQGYRFYPNHKYILQEIYLS